jgi:hypothetical protein
MLHENSGAGGVSLQDRLGSTRPSPPGPAEQTGVAPGGDFS